MALSFRTSGNYVNLVNIDETVLHVETTIKSLHKTSRCIDWSLPGDTSKITFTIDEVKYENVPIVDIDFDGTPMDSQDDFETGITGMFTGLSGDGGNIALVSKTYAELVALINSSGLTAGQQYLISDFATVHYIFDWNGDQYNINTGVNEPIIVTANSPNTIDEFARSTLHPEDLLSYDWNQDNWLLDVAFANSGVIVAGWKGTITFRHDMLLDNYTGYDFRNCKFRRWKTDVPAYAGGTTYGAGDFVTDTGFIYRSLLASNIGHTPASSADYWAQIIDLSLSLYWLPRPSSFLNITAGTDFADFLTFAEGSGSATYAESCRSNHFEPFKDNNDSFDNTGSLLTNNIFFLQDRGRFTLFSNNFCAECVNNTFGGDAQYNSCGADFADNVISNAFSVNDVAASFRRNVIGNSFSANFIGTQCAFNYVSDSFQNNIIGNGCSSNTLGSAFDGNTIGNSFQNNKMGGIRNTIGNYFHANIAKNGFTMNTIKDNMNLDAAGIDFTSATHVYATYSCDIFINHAGTKRLSYFDNSDVLTVVNANA